ncbi:MAG TPA: TonB-dependent receptor [Terriglobales bacterium]|nr:TonB-dependent receptor [Terriglobales bacterium]
MRSLERDSRFRRLSARLAIVVAASTLVPTVAAKTAQLSGIIFTIGADGRQTVWANARVTLRNLDSGDETNTVSSELGVYVFRGVLSAAYEVRVTLTGFEPMTKSVTLGGGEARLDFQLALKKREETVTVSAEPSGVDLTSSNGGSPTLTANMLKSLIQANQDFQDALPLLPGVVRGPDGEIHIKGGRADQSSTLVNTASVADPFTGQPALRIPSIAVQSVRVLSNPFSAEYGRFSSGVVEVTTRGGTDEWKFLFEDPIPRFRWINYHTHGVESASPHLTFSGPLKLHKLYVFQSLAYGYDVQRTTSLPNPDNVRITEGITTYTQLDWIPVRNHQFTAVLTIDPRNTDFANIDTFNPQPVTADYQQRTFFTSATDRWILSSGGFVQSLFSAKRLDVHVFPADSTPGEMVLFPEQNSGSYFEQQRRRTRLYQWAQALHLRPLESAGRHLLTFGYSYTYSSYEGNVSNLPVNVLREDQTLTTQIVYRNPLPSAASENQVAIFAQDNWQLGQRLTLDLGVRLDRDSLAIAPWNAAPRMGFVFAPTHDNRTAIRGGVGVFYDKIPLNVAVFRAFPAQTITTFADDGTTILSGPLTFNHVIRTADGQLRVPYSLGWSLQFDRDLGHGLLFRFGYENRHGFREFYVNPWQTTSIAQLQLLNSGQQSYREFLWMVRWRAAERTTLYASFVRSKAQGDLNDYNQFFGNFPYPLIRPNQTGILPSDAPNRGLFWGVFALPHKFDFIPTLDIHTGFPFSKLDDNWNYVGQRNQAGRFPPFVGFDTKVQYPVDFKFRGHRIQFRAGLSVLDALNYANPRDVQENDTSPHYGTFYNPIGRLWRLDGDFDF